MSLTGKNPNIRMRVKNSTQNKIFSEELQVQLILLFLKNSRVSPYDS